MGLDERLVEDAPEGGAELLARPRHVGGDRGGIGDDLVLEARVELQVARLVDLLGGEEVVSSSSSARRPGPVNWVVIRSSATISEESAHRTASRSAASIASHCRAVALRSTS